MWCLNCSTRTSSDICENCKSDTVDIPAMIYWCEHCRAPVIIEELDKLIGLNVKEHVCPHCGSLIQKMSSDLRPVFPEERTLILGLLTRLPATTENDYNQELKQKLCDPSVSVWINLASILYLDGVSYRLPSQIYESFFNLSVDEQNLLREEIGHEKIAIREGQTSRFGASFVDDVTRFLKCNELRRRSLTVEAENFIQDTTEHFSAKKLKQSTNEVQLNNNVMVSFSGGKDSTVVSNLVINALSDPMIPHVFGDTTLEMPMTYEYFVRSRDFIPCLIKVRNDYRSFISMCEELGPPSRVMRWCCTTFKTGPITELIQKWFKNERVLTFYGVRHSESVSRSKYKRVENKESAVKIAAQTVASPIIEWLNVDVWNYILGENLMFNDAYRLGFDRVGCWCCPNNSSRSAVLAAVYMKDEYQKWRDFLIQFSRDVLKKPDATNYVDSGKWKARQGGNNIKLAQDVQVQASDCTTDDNAFLFKLTHPITEHFYELFIPLGKRADDLGRPLLKEVMFVDYASKVRLFSVMPFALSGAEYAIKVQVYEPSRVSELKTKISYQVRKYNICRRCMKCLSVCRFGAISIEDEYRIDATKCTHCGQCVSDTYITGGCLISKFLRIKGNKLSE